MTEKDQTELHLFYLSHKIYVSEALSKSVYDRHLNIFIQVSTYDTSVI